MSQITSQRITYKELSDSTYLIKDDHYGIASFITNNIRKTLLANPNKLDESKTAILLKLNDGIVVGRKVLFETKIKIGNRIVLAQTGGSIEVCKEYRGRGIGVNIINESINSEEFDIYIGALYSSMALPIFKKLNIIILEVPQYVKIFNFNYILESFGLKGIVLKIISKPINMLFGNFGLFNKYRLWKLKNKFFIKKEKIIPEWAGEIATNDGNKYMEVHDTKWLQWNLDYNYNNHDKDNQSFYAVYDKDNNPKGFFFTKERFTKNTNRYKNIVHGTIVEWGTVDNALLNEADLNMMALSTFSKDVFSVLTIASVKKTQKYLKRMGFLRHGSFHISINDKKNQFEDISNPNLWRLRFGCCNTIFC